MNVLVLADGAGFYGRVAYHEWEGVSDDHEECERLARSFSKPEPVDPPLPSDLLPHTLMMRNHGAVTAGASVGQAFVRMFYLARICDVQLKVLGAGGANEASAAILASDALKYTVAGGEHGDAEWRAMRQFYKNM